ncbi:MAG: hypothetical protein RMM53_13145, partial [Bacteroidia bacterium]|nr:hypothetical protein [Bacteroidia bacterium]MDW8335154.1 hypothetical protein [Bacteroidia bacterium]
RVVSRRRLFFAIGKKGQSGCRFNRTAEIVSQSPQTIEISRLSNRQTLNRPASPKKIGSSPRDDPRTNAGPLNE